MRSERERKGGGWGREWGEWAQEEQESKRARKVHKAQATLRLINHYKDFDLFHQNNVKTLDDFKSRY